MDGDGGQLIDESTIGGTPLIELDLDIDPTVYAKVEWFNLYAVSYGGGSIKSRIAKAMLDAAENEGILPGKTVIEPTSGNTGSEIARIGCARGYAVEVVMPDNAASGKINAIRDAGGRIHFVDADLGYDAVLDQCAAIMTEHPDTYYRPDQYSNPANPGIHETTTASEIWEQTDGTVTTFMAGVGTGGTITGTGRGLHARGDVRVVAFEPADPLHAIDGLKYLRTGGHYHPETYDTTVPDDLVYVDTGAAYDQARALREHYVEHDIRIQDPGQYTNEFVRKHLRVNGEFIVGPSSGAAIGAVTELADNELDATDVVVIVFADRGDKYLGIPLWSGLFTEGD